MWVTPRCVTHAETYTSILRQCRFAILIARTYSADKLPPFESSCGSLVQEPAANDEPAQQEDSKDGGEERGES